MLDLSDGQVDCEPEEMQMRDAGALPDNRNSPNTADMGIVGKYCLGIRSGYSLILMGYSLGR